MLQSRLKRIFRRAPVGLQSPFPVTMRNRSRNKFFAATPGAVSASALGPLAHFNQPLPILEFSNDVCPERLQPLEQRRIGRVTDS
jgi:hypothetical protein